MIADPDLDEEIRGFRSRRAETFGRAFGHRIAPGAEAAALGAADAPFRTPRSPARKGAAPGRARLQTRASLLAMRAEKLAGRDDPGLAARRIGSPRGSGGRQDKADDAVLKCRARNRSGMKIIIM